MSRACREQMVKVYADEVTLGLSKFDAAANRYTEFPFPLTYYIDRGETEDAVLREVVDYFCQRAFDSGEPTGVEPGVQVDRACGVYTEYLVTYVHARRFVYYGRPMEGELVCLPSRSTLFRSSGSTASFETLPARVQYF